MISASWGVARLLSASLMSSDIPHCCSWLGCTGERAAVPGSSPLYLPGHGALASGSCWQEPAYVPAHCNSLPGLLVQIEAVKANSQERELGQMKCWPGSRPASAGQRPTQRSSREPGEVSSAPLPWWLGVLSEHFSLPQLTLPGAQVIALVLTERSFNTFPCP